MNSLDDSILNEQEFQVVNPHNDTNDANLDTFNYADEDPEDNEEEEETEQEIIDENTNQDFYVDSYENDNLLYEDEQENPNSLPKNDDLAPYECDKCNQLFNTKTGLTKHLKTHSSQQTPNTSNQNNRFECTHCYKSFTTRTTLIDHIRIHTGEKPFTCTYCNKSFNVKSNLVRHYKVHGRNKINFFFENNFQLQRFELIF